MVDGAMVVESPNKARPLYRVRMVAPTIQNKMPSTLACPSLLETSTSSNLKSKSIIYMYFTCLVRFHPNNNDEQQNFVFL